jgi:hypothetical protein
MAHQALQNLTPDNLFSSISHFSFHSRVRAYSCQSQGLPSCHPLLLAWLYSPHSRCFISTFHSQIWTNSNASFLQKMLLITLWTKIRFRASYNFLSSSFSEFGIIHLCKLLFDQCQSPLSQAVRPIGQCPCFFCSLLTHWLVPDIHWVLKNCLLWGKWRKELNYSRHYNQHLFIESSKNKRKWLKKTEEMCLCNYYLSSSDS